MYILQISDLHISPSINLKSLKEKIAKLVDTLSGLVPADSNILCCLLGDFTDKGNPRSFDTAAEAIAELKAGLSGMLIEGKVEYEILPGNHDLCRTSIINSKKNLSEFDRFATKVVDRPIVFSDTPIIENVHFGYRFLSLNTVFLNTTDYGSVNFSALESFNQFPDSIVLAHHGVVSSDDSDSSVIRNGYRLHQFLERGNCVAFLHGHTHGYKHYSVGSNCQIIGVGPMFKNEGQYDISNQCNLIEITGSSVREVKTLLYQGDRGCWDSTLVYQKVEDYNYVSSDVYALYSRILNDATENRLLPNLRIQIQTSFTSYEKEITDKFSACEADAVAWQGLTPSEYLPDTHGRQMNVKDHTWQNFIITTLKNNPTSKRAIIPLIDREKAFCTPDDKYLVSLDIIQFGFASNSLQTLYITVYMRALEVRYFLPVNLYELYLIARELKEAFPMIENLKICIFAYRAEAKKDYACFKKADIDLLSESQLCAFFSKGNYGKIVSLLLQKSKMGDTVIDVAWLSKLKNAVKYCCEAKNKEELLAQIEVVQASLDSLKQIRTHCSDYSATQAKEDSYCTDLNSLIHLFEVCI